MDKTIEKYYSEHILAEMALRYAVLPKQLKLFRDQVDLIFSCNNKGEEFIFRLAHSSKQTSDKIFSEVDWLDHLNKAGVNIAFPIASAEGNLMEIIKADDTYFTVVKFNKAAGRQVTFKDWNENFYRAMGSLTGQIHLATKNYIPSAKVILRDDCIKTDAARVERNQLENDTGLLNLMQKLLQKLNALPRDKDSYGLLHNDINDGNMFIDNGKICLFDSADCAYTWFITDIAVILLYAVLNFDNNYPRERLSKLIRHFMTNFWEGYLQHNILRESDVEFIPDMMHLKSVFMFDHIQKVYSNQSTLNHVQKNYFNQVKSLCDESFDFLNINLIKF
jgi:amicoumacin kinase